MKYAHPEHERKFLLPALPGQVVPEFRVIEDRYFPGTTLRLRRVSEPAGKLLSLKLNQKKRDSAGRIWITSTYLAPSEYQLLSALPGLDLKKRRYRLSSLPGACIDVIPAESGTLFIAEIEGGTAAEIAGDFPQLNYIREITDEEYFSGFQIASRLQPGPGKRLAPEKSIDES